MLGKRFRSPFLPIHSLSGRERILTATERAIKGALFGCSMCGNCLLQETAYICPLLCPKGLRNGPCGSGSADGCCVDSSRPCAWHLIYERAEVRGTLDRPLEVRAPLDWSRTGRETWGTFLAEMRTRGLLSPVRFDNMAAWPAEVAQLFHDLRQPAWWRGDDENHRPPSAEPVSKLQAALERGEFVVTAEASPPVGARVEAIRQKAARLKEYLHATNVTQNPMARPRMSSMACSALLLEQGVEPILQLTARDYNRFALQSEALGASALGIRNTLCLTGDPPANGPGPVGGLPFDLDATQMLWILRRMRDEGILLDGRPLTGLPKLFLGTAASPGDPMPEHEARRLEKKINAGAQFIQTQLVIDTEGLKRWLDALASRDLLAKAHILVGIGPLKSTRVARFMRDKIPDIVMPAHVIDRMERGQKPQETGLSIALELIDQIRHLIKYPKPLEFKESTDRERAVERIPAWRISPPARPWWLGAKGLLGLLLSTALAEIAGGAVYVALIERAYQLGSGMASVGVVLLVQSVTQALLGFGAGGLADTWGQRKTAGFAALAVALLATGLAFSNTVLQVYLLGFLLMIARLLLIPARFGLVAQVTTKDRLVDTNTALALLSGAGSFIGPAMVTMLLLVSDTLVLPLLVSSMASLLSIPPLALIRSQPEPRQITYELDVWQEMRAGLRVIGKRLTIRQVLLCLVNITLLLGAAMPLFTPLARHFGFGSEGTGIFFTALGFGYLAGPFMATALFKRMRLSTALFLAGLLGPTGLMIIGVVGDLEIVLVAIALIAMTSAGVNVMVTTVVQRLSPRERQGSVFGVQQALVGLAWTFSLAMITGITAIWEHLNIQLLFLQLGAFGFLAIFACWMWSRRSAWFACDMCQASPRSIHFACWVSRNSPFQLPGFVPRGKCCNGTCLCHR